MALFKSNHKGFVQVVRHRTPARFNNITGEPVEWHERLAAEFGTFGPEVQIFNPETGEMTETADIRGGFYDSVSAQSQFGYTDEERQAIEQKLREVAQRRPDFVQEIVAQHVPATAPWQTFDQMEPVEIVKAAKTLGLVPEAVRYEREGQARPEVLEPLEADLAKMDEETQQRAEPIMQIPAAELVPGSPHGVSLGAAPQFTDTGIPLSTPGFVPKAGSHTITL